MRITQFQPTQLVCRFLCMSCTTRLENQAPVPIGRRATHSKKIQLAEVREAEKGEGQSGTERWQKRTRTCRGATVQEGSSLLGGYGITLMHHQHHAGSAGTGGGGPSHGRRTNRALAHLRLLPISPVCVCLV